MRLKKSVSRQPNIHIEDVTGVRYQMALLILFYELSQKSLTERDFENFI